MAGPTEESVNESIEETGGIPEVSFEVEVFGMTQTAVDKTLSIEDMAADAKATGDAIALVASEVTDLALDVAAVSARTGEDIPLTTDPESSTIAEAIEGIVGESYPVGTIYMTASAEAPAFLGEWEEIRITATWSQLKSGTRDYAEMEEGQTGGTVHFWLRTA